MGFIDFVKTAFSDGRISKLNSQIPHRYVVFDIETTGFSRSDDRIIEIAANEYTNGQISNRFHTYVNPGRHIPNAITRLTGIRDSDVYNAPTIGQAKRDVLRFFGSATLVGHNINTFDVPFLEAQFRCSIQNPRIDTLLLAKKEFPGLPNYKLSTLDQILELGRPEHHRAENDVAVNNALFLACCSPQQHRKRVSDPRILCSVTDEAHLSLYPKIDINSFSATDPDAHPNTVLTGKGIAFTGEFNLLREEMYQIAVDAGAILKSHVSKKVSYLVLGIGDPQFLDENGTSSKERTAMKLKSEGHNIKIIDESEFLAMAAAMVSIPSE